jgi:hypothetical protein
VPLIRWFPMTLVTVRVRTVLKNVLQLSEAGP